MGYVPENMATNYSIAMIPRTLHIPVYVMHARMYFCLFTRVYKYLNCKKTRTLMYKFWKAVALTSSISAIDDIIILECSRVISKIIVILTSMIVHTSWLSPGH